MWGERIASPRKILLALVWFLVSDDCSLLACSNSPAEISCHFSSLLAVADGFAVQRDTSQGHSPLCIASDPFQSFNEAEGYADLCHSLSF